MGSGLVTIKSVITNLGDRLSLKKSTLLFLMLSCQFTYAANELSQLNLASTEWCPYACDSSSSTKGMAQEYVTYILGKHNIKTKVTYYPWARAVRQVESGSQHGLLTAVPSESPNLLFTQQAMMTYQMCFYGQTNLDWRFVDKDSLAQVRLGVIAQYGYGEPVDSYISDLQNARRIIQLSGDGGLKRLISMLDSGWIDIFIADKNVYNWQKTQQSQTALEDIKQINCLAETPFFLALSPRFSSAPAVIKLLDSEFSNQDNQHWLQHLRVSKYQ